MAEEIRQLAADEHESLSHTLAAAFGGEHRPAEVERFQRLLPGRDFGAFEDGNLVGVTTSHPLELSIPGGSLRAAGVTGVGVVPTHRRRGILTRLTRRQLEQLLESGEPLAFLWASEGGIYGRFGYGVASRNARANCERDRTVLREDGPPKGSVRLLTIEEARDELPDVYERVAVETPGFFVRAPVWWEWHRLYDPEHERDGGSPLFCAALELDGRLEGYALYRRHNRWEQGVSTGRLEVVEQMATSAVAVREIWRFLLGVDLVKSIQVALLPIDHPLFLLVTEPSRLRLSVGDGIWLRLVDVQKALSRRSYAAEEAITIDLADSFCAWNEGCYRIEAAVDGAAVELTTTAPDLRLDVGDLASVFLGGFSFLELALAGRVVENTPGALQRADHMFRTDRAPWCPEVF